MGNKVFSERIKKLRIDSNMTMDMLAKKLNITKSRISMWENNGTVPREDILLELSKLYNVSIDYLLGNDEITCSVLKCKIFVEPSVIRQAYNLKAREVEVGSVVSVKTD